MHVALASETDFAGFRVRARALLASQVPPHEVQWITGSADADLFGGQEQTGQPELPPQQRQGHPQAGAPAVPAGFLAMCETLALHGDPQRHALMYRLLWRLSREPALRHDPLDADMLLARQMARAVQHEMHKMRAFVRFREVPDAQAPGGVRHVAWFEPRHHIVEANAPWFARRFANMHWAILTPRRCVAWDGQVLAFRPGAKPHDAPAPDAGESLWLAYYRSIFNPARLKLAALRREMPRRYWSNLPEAVLIEPLSAQAQERSGAMLQQAAQAPQRRVVRIVRPAAPPAPRADTLAGLAEAVQLCRACPIGQHATQAVPGEGPLRPQLMVVGEQPGDREDLMGRAFVGPAGELLDSSFAQAGIEREAVYLTNAVRHFKFELRGRRRIHKTPAQAEALACGHWLEQEIALVQPRALLALGATAARSLLGRPVAITQERGSWHRRANGLAVFVTWHPAALLRMAPQARAAAMAVFVEDLRAASGDWRAALAAPQP